MNILFKENIRTIRKAYGFSQSEMADRLSIPEKRYQSYEEGRGEPNLAETYRFCCTLNFTLDQLLIINIAKDFTLIKINQLALKKSKALATLVNNRGNKVKEVSPMQGF